MLNSSVERPQKFDCEPQIKKGGTRDSPDQINIMLQHHEKIVTIKSKGQEAMRNF